MRAARLLQILLLLQNRGRLTSAQLAEELEVTRRTILRDVDAMTEAGLPVQVFQGNRGGIELGFNYRTRLTGLAADEAEALGVILGATVQAVAALDMGKAADRARAKLLESFPDKVRNRAQQAQARFRFDIPAPPLDPRVAALAHAVRERKTVRINARSAAPRALQPEALLQRADGWFVIDRAGDEIALADCGDLNVSAKTFD
ncbi:MAG: HTH domain-containing protein [Pseudomonadota bacterium]